MIRLRSNKALCGCEKAKNHQKKEQQQSPQIRLRLLLFSITVAWYTHTCLTKTTVNAQYYITVLKQLMKDHTPKKRLDLFEKWKLPHNNAQPHVAHSISTSLVNKMTKWYHNWPTVRIWLPTISSFTSPWKRSWRGSILRPKLPLTGATHKPDTF